MDKERLYQRVHAMIESSTKVPKYMSISSVKVADLFGVHYKEVEEGLKELLAEGRLHKSKLQDPPNAVIYKLQ
jgi:hypothetical protein